MPQITRRATLGLGLAFSLGACARGPFTAASKSTAGAEPALYPNETPALRRLINKWADHYEVPRELVHAQIVRESTHRPGARNGPYWGLMQILPQTARTMGHRGPPQELLDPDVNLEFAVKYLRGAWIVSGGDKAAAMKWYARGYYYEAKRLGLLEETGLRT
jgi:soluble lytic murein transglycosylase-like protein